MTLTAYPRLIKSPETVVILREKSKQVKLGVVDAIEGAAEAGAVVEARGVEEEAFRRGKTPIRLVAESLKRNLHSHRPTLTHRQLRTQMLKTAKKNPSRWTLTLSLRRLRRRKPLRLVSRSRLEGAAGPEEAVVVSIALLDPMWAPMRARSL